MADRYSERRGQRWEDDERRAHGEARGRDHDDRRDDRGFLDRAGDELRSWFGDEEAQRRRMMDEREDWRGEWRRPRAEWTREPDQRDWSRQWGHVEGRGPGREYGMGGYGAGVSGYGSWGRERDWGGQGPGGFGTSSGWREEWSAGRGDRDWGRYAGLGQSREAMRGPHTGRGPRNYQRSDERIREDVCERLSQHGHLDASDIDVRVQSGEVTMEGTVTDRWAKRTAEDLVENVWGVKEVHNQLRVSQPAFGQGGQEGREQQQNRAPQQRGPWAA